MHKRIKPDTFTADGVDFKSLPKAYPGACFHRTREGRRVPCAGGSIGSAVCQALHSAGHACHGNNRPDRQHVIHVVRYKK